MQYVNEIKAGLKGPVHVSIYSITVVVVAAGGGGGVGGGGALEHKALSASEPSTVCCMPTHPT